jgi:hypothetical protein
MSVEAAQPSGYCAPAVTFRFPVGLRGLSPRHRPPRSREFGFILSCASPPLQSPDRIAPARRISLRATFLGVRFSIATSMSRVHSPTSFPPRLCSALSVSHALDGLLLSISCGLVSSRCHVRDVLFRDFPRCPAASTRRRCVPSCRCWRLPPAGHPRLSSSRPLAFRALLRAPIRRDEQSV